jgi:ABC-type transport system involved in multi-copper enzyme maturation permease subunit
MKIFGPVLGHDLVRMSRRSRHLFLRWSYALLLFALIAWMYRGWHSKLWRQPTRSDYTALNSRMYYTFMAVQFGAVLLLTPSYTAGTIAEEKERKSLDFLLTTDLRNREIVLGKLAARVVSIVVIILAGLPILCFLQLLGGVGPDLVAGTFGATIATVCGLAGLGVAVSTFTRRTRDAILLTYLIMFAYGVLSLCLYFAAASPSARSTVAAGVNLKGLWPDSWQFWLFPWRGVLRVQFTVGDAVAWMTCGNPIVSTLELFQTSKGNVTAALPVVLRRYVFFHAVLALFFPVLAMHRLKSANQPESRNSATRLRRWRWWPRPHVGRWPMLWKELHVESGLKVGAIARMLVAGIFAVLVLASFWPVAGMLWQYQLGVNSVFRHGLTWLASEAGEWVSLVGTAVTMLSLIVVAVRAAGSLSSEKDRETLSDLLATPITSREILFAKWIGAMAAARACWLWLAAVWFTAWYLGGLQIISMVCAAVSWVVFAFAAAGIGFWFSAHARTTLRAIVWTLVVTVIVNIAPWVVLTLLCEQKLGRYELVLNPWEALALGSPVYVVATFLSDDRLTTHDISLVLCIFSILGWFIVSAILLDRMARRLPDLLNRRRRRAEKPVASADPPALDVRVATESCPL